MTILIHDYETTGTDVRLDHPVQIGVCDQDGRILMNTLCDPCMEIAPEAEAVHGISAFSVIGFPDYLAALFVEDQLFKAYGTEHTIIAGFNTSMFDNPLMENCLPGCSLSQFRKLDLLDVIYRYYPALEQKKLTELHKNFLGYDLEGAHGAIQDCIGTAKVLEYVCADLGKTPEQLSEELSSPQVYSVMPIGKHRGKPISSVPDTWARWMDSNAKNLRPDLQATVNYLLGVSR